MTTKKETVIPNNGNISLKNILNLSRGGFSSSITGSVNQMHGIEFSVPNLTENK